MKDRSMKVSGECENLVYANSGMYWLEKSIETFASNYLLTISASSLRDSFVVC